MKRTSVGEPFVMICGGQIGSSPFLFSLEEAGPIMGGLKKIQKNLVAEFHMPIQGGQLGTPLINVGPKSLALRIDQNRRIESHDEIAGIVGAEGMTFLINIQKKLRTAHRLRQKAYPFRKQSDMYIWRCQ